MKKYSKLYMFLESFNGKFINWYMFVGVLFLFIMAALGRYNTLGFDIVSAVIIISAILMLISSLLSIRQKNYTHSLLNIRRFLYRKRKLYNKYLVCINKIHDKIKEQGDLSFEHGLNVVMKFRRESFVEEIKDIMMWLSFGKEISEDEKLFKEYDLIAKHNDLFIAAVLNKNLDKNSIFKQNYLIQEKVENILHEIDSDISLISVKVSAKFVL